MSWQPQANQRDVLNHSGITGLAGWFSNGLPHGYNKTTTGGGSVNTSGEVIVSGGTTVDDTASVGTHRQYNSKFKRTVDVYYRCVGGEVTTDRCLVGLGRGSGFGDIGLYMDLLNDEYRAGSSAHPCSVSPTNNLQNHLHIEEDPSVDETTFYHRTNVGTETVTVPDTSFDGLGEDAVRVESNGGGEEIAPMYHRVTFTD